MDHFVVFLKGSTNFAKKVNKKTCYFMQKIDLRWARSKLGMYMKLYESKREAESRENNRRESPVHEGMMIPHLFFPHLSFCFYSMLLVFNFSHVSYPKYILLGEFNCWWRQSRSYRSFRLCYMMTIIDLQVLFAPLLLLFGLEQIYL